MLLLLGGIMLNHVKLQLVGLVGFVFSDGHFGQD